MVNFLFKLLSFSLQLFLHLDFNSLDLGIEVFLDLLPPLFELIDHDFILEESDLVVDVAGLLEEPIILSLYLLLFNLELLLVAMLKVLNLKLVPLFLLFLELFLSFVQLGLPLALDLGGSCTFFVLGLPHTLVFFRLQLGSAGCHSLFSVLLLS
jgi:hypothetical protein